MKNTDIIITTADIITAVQTFTCDYVINDKRPKGSWRTFTVKAVHDNFFVEVLFSKYEDLGPFHIKAEVVKGADKDIVLNFVSPPTQRGLESLTRWLRATLALEL